MLLYHQQNTDVMLKHTNWLQKAIGRNFVMSPTHAAAYLVGFRKRVTLSDKKLSEIGTEITHMQESPDYLVRPAGNWHEHGIITEGTRMTTRLWGPDREWAILY
jgi:hypothetical protein